MSYENCQGSEVVSIDRIPLRLFLNLYSDAFFFICLKRFMDIQIIRIFLFYVPVMFVYVHLCRASPGHACPCSARLARRHTATPHHARLWMPTPMLYFPYVVIIILHVIRKIVKATLRLYELVYFSKY